MAQAEILVTAAMVAAFAAIHLLIHRLHFINTTPRSKWLSFSGGVAVAYIFLHVLPDLGAHAEALAREMRVTPVGAESIVYALALAGLAAFYGVERRVTLNRARSREAGQSDEVEVELLWVHVASYSVLNLLVGYLLLHREEEGGWALGLYFGAMALHFVTADYGMRTDHEAAYDRMGRWVLAAAVTAGWALGLALTFPAPVIAGLYAFLAGGIVLTVLKEELPEERQSYFLPFLGGVLLYAALVLLERLSA
jgi:hypothetical protein